MSGMTDSELDSYVVTLTCSQSLAYDWFAVVQKHPAISVEHELYVVKRNVISKMYGAYGQAPTVIDEQIKKAIAIAIAKETGNSSHPALTD